MGIDAIGTAIQGIMDTISGKTQDEKISKATKPNVKQEQKNAANYQDNGYQDTAQSAVTENAKGAGQHNVGPEDQFFSPFESGKSFEKEYNEGSKAADQNELQLKAKLIQDGQKQGLSHDAIKNDIDTIDHTANHEAINADDDNKYLKDYQNAGGSYNHSTKQQVTKDKALLYQSEYNAYNNNDMFAFRAGHEQTNFKDTKARSEKINHELGMDKTTKQFDTKTNGQIKDFEKQNQLSDNRADHYLAKTQVDRQNDPKGDHPGVHEFAKKFSDLHAKDLKDGTATVKDQKLNQAFTQLANKTPQLQNQNGKSTQQTLAKYQNDNDKIEQQSQHQNQNTASHQRDALAKD